MSSLRAQYLAHEVTHRDYYGAVVECLGEAALRSCLPVTYAPSEWRALIAEDEHLNNVPLRKWDAKDSLVRRIVRLRLSEVSVITGSKGWSLCETVCVLKETAKRFAESEAR